MKIGPIEVKLERIFLFGVLGILLFLVMDFNARLEDLNRKQEKLDEVSARATDLMNTQVALQTQVAYAASDEAAEAWARQQAGMAQPGDNPIVPLPAPGATPIAENIPPQPTPTPFTRWDVWMQLLFGK